MIGRILVANRGEIALRVIRACRELEIESVAVFSDADRQALHAAAADRAVALGPARSSESYLAIPKLIDAARATGCDAVHPGYGFLSENPSFAAACEAANLKFIGPSSSVMARMGSKTGARALMQAAGVPVVPGATPADQSDRAIAQAVHQVGFPALLKAAGGGGGRGMRLIAEAGGLEEAISSARREALSAFGNLALYVERALVRPGHVEVQVFGDAHGAMLHFFERECSIQRRHQKIIEESPSPGLPSSLREKLTATAVRAASAAGYRNAGTVEFLLDGKGDKAQFFFLEMNTRLQVEHPVTEAVTGVDLVHLQIAVADDQPLGRSQGSIQQRGHAIECRIYAEDPADRFLPQAGRLLLYRQPSVPGVRIDSGVREGDDIPVEYDPLLAKVIAWAETREGARRKIIAALRDFPILGVRTNVGFLIHLLQTQAFRDGKLDTTFIERLGTFGADADHVFALACAAAAADRRRTGTPPSPPGATGPSAPPDPWTSLESWRI